MYFSLFVLFSGQLCVATASVYFHVFFTRYSLKQFDRWEVAMTCFFLASKVEERRMRVDSIIGSYYQVRQQFEMELIKRYQELHVPLPAQLARNRVGLTPKPEAQAWNALRARVYHLEELLLDTIEYSFEVIHPYTFLNPILLDVLRDYVKCDEAFIMKHLKEAGGVAQISWNFINDRSAVDS